MSFPTKISQVGLTAVLVMIDGEFDDNSPAVIEVITRDCTFAGSRKTADADGNCVCAWQYEEFSDGDCHLQSALLSDGAIAGISVAGVVLLGLAWLGARVYRQVCADSLWKIPPESITWPSPPVVLGRGTYGEVLCALYRG
ncbi:unnamed protein product, partial [Phaeothamnion confervicola]